MQPTWLGLGLGLGSGLGIGLELEMQPTGTKARPAGKALKIRWKIRPSA